MVRPGRRVVEEFVGQEGVEGGLYGYLHQAVIPRVLPIYIYIIRIIAPWASNTTYMFSTTVPETWCEEGIARAFTGN